MRQPHGQNFLTDINIASKIVEAAELSPDDNVIEIGPGRGILTRLIAPLSKSFKTIEIDGQLIQNLKDKFESYKNTEIIHADFLDYPFVSEPGPLKIISNLPYNVSTAAIEKILPEKNWTIAVLMVQKETGARLLASPSTGDYGYFTIFCRYYANIEKLISVDPGCFFPKPKVDSVVLKFTRLYRDKLDERFCGFIKSAFSQRRKTAVNSISSSFSIPKETVINAFKKSMIGTNLRPENLDIDAFSQLYKNLFF